MDNHKTLIPQIKKLPPRYQDQHYRNSVNGHESFDPSKALINYLLDDFS